MDFRAVKGQFGTEFDTAIPCQLRFTRAVEQDTTAFHDALEERGFGALDADPARTTGETTGPYYDGEVVSREDYKRIRVLVFRSEVVRVYPRENQPDVDDVAAIIEALEAGFGSSLDHDPIE